MAIDLPFFCGRCGVSRVAARGESCGPCRATPRLEDVACGVCGAPSSFADIRGFRCSAHVNVPSAPSGFAGERVAGFWGRNIERKGD